MLAKKFFHTLVCSVVLLISTQGVWAQLAPFAIPYQAVVRNANGELVKNAEVFIRISILKNAPQGQINYVETQRPTTNANGLLSIQIGQGTAEVGALSSISWQDGVYFVRTQVDPSGGNSPTLDQTTQLMSVPFSFHANTANQITGTLNENDPLFSAWNRSTGILINESQISDLKNYLLTESDPVFSNSLAAGISPADTSRWNGKQNRLQAGQGIRIEGNTISASSTTSNLDFYLGQDTLGGIVFYLYQDEKGRTRGMVVSKMEGNERLQSPASFTGGNRTWDGEYNTNLLVDSPAKEWAENLGEGWYIPSVDEMGILWRARFHVNKKLNDLELPLLSTTALYWTSTESSGTNAYQYSFGAGGLSTTGKANALPIRAIKAF
jgi:hypothetical protein